MDILANYKFALVYLFIFGARVCAVRNLFDVFLCGYESKRKSMQAN